MRRLPAMRQLVLVTLLGFASFCLTLSSLPSYAAANGATDGTAGLVTTVMLVCTVATQMLVPAAVDRFGLGPVLVFGLVALGPPTLLYLVSPGLGWLLIVSGVRGFGFAVLTVLGSTITARIAPPGRMGEAVGIYGLAIAVPNLLAVPGGVALQAAGHFAVVAVLAATPVLAVPFVRGLTRGVAVRRTDGEGPSGPARSAVRAVAAPASLLLVVTLAGGGLVTFLPIAWPGGAVASVALLLFGATGALTRWAVGVAADQLGVRWLLPLSLVTAVVGLTGLGVSLAAGSGAGSVVGALVSATVFGAGYGAVQNLTLVVALASTPQDNVASAVWNVGFDSGTALGAFAVGAVAATGLGLPWTFALSAAPILLALPLARARAVMRPA